jgi:tetratricopeptide (TPR) repeat protein
MDSLPGGEGGKTMEDPQFRRAVGISVNDDRPLPVVLDEDSRRRVVEDDFGDLRPWVDQILELDLTGLPDASLLAAALLFRTDRRRRALEQAKARALIAHDHFADADDDAGRSLACLLLGHLEWWAGETHAADEWWDIAAGLSVEGAVPAGLAPFRVMSDLLDRGNLRSVVTDSHMAYAMSVAEGSLVDEANATLMAGLLTVDGGDLTRAVATLERADDLFSEIPSDDDRTFWPGVYLGLGDIAAWRGDVEGAMAYYATAGERAHGLGHEGWVNLSRCQPAMTLHGQPHVDLLSEAEHAAQQVRDDGSHWVLRSVAERALATALLESGQAVRALEIADAATAEAPNAMVRAKTLTIVARARRALELDGAAEALDEAATTFLDEGADLWAVATLIELAEFRPADASRSLDLAYEHTHDDVAFTRLWSARPRLRIQLDPAMRSRFSVDGVNLALGTKGERLAEVVAAAGDAGIHWETVARSLWPGETDSDRVKSRLTSLTALVRSRLGADGWRLRRDGPCFSFVTLAAEVVSRTDPTVDLHRPSLRAS